MSEEIQIFAQSEIGSIPLEWDIKTLKDVCLQEKGAIISGPFGSNIGRRFFVKKGIPVIRGNNLTTDFTKFVDDGFVFITNEKANELGTWAEQEDLVFTAAGTLGQVAIIPPKRKFDKYIISNKQLRARLDKRLIVPLFAFYWFQSKKMVDFINMRNTGSTIPLINLSILKSLPLPVPPVQEQKAIVKMLATLDSKIELNQQMNKTLEAIGQAIFKRWFVDFEFPNEEGKPYKSSGGEMEYNEELSKDVPKGWVVKKLGEFIRFIRGTSYRSEDLKPSENALVSLKCMARGGGFNAEGLKSYAGKYKEEQILHSGDIVVAHTDITQKAEVLGKPALIREVPSFKKLIASMDMGIVRPIDRQSNAFIYYLLKTESFQNHIIGYANGTTVLHLSNKGVPEYLLALPPNELTAKFGSIGDVLFKRIEKSALQSETLSQLRDMLLPRLMSGKIRVLESSVKEGEGQ